ncbi:hypothetical protein [Spirosoma sordidisoli]|uniref:DUF3311 domain-containing protein n=1 Tax=Spirosoma sordidisoli TaxID=2502893 RepID=A0A4Q2UUV0_9BACT|nr:hypothetical protein [Spirosoma sordidisoli]RYC71590.1 hypothetical protein EQG79_05485 [Spirosoma sordidisoli]
MKTRRLLLLSIVFMLLFNEPFLSIVNVPDLTGGLPGSYAYVLVVWAALIVSLVICLHGNHNADDSFHPDE